MNNLQIMEQEKRVLRWGGLSGILGGFLFILALVFVEMFIPSDPSNLTQWVARFPDIHTNRVIENCLYLVALIFEAPLFLALVWALRKTSLGPALFGSVLGIVGLVAMVVSATPHVAHAPLSELYHATGTTPEAQATLALVWQATWGVFNAPLYVGFFVVMIGLILLGAAMFGAPDFGKGFGWMSMLLGVVGLAAAVLQMVYPAAIKKMALINVVWKLDRLGRSMQHLIEIVKRPPFPVKASQIPTQVLPGCVLGHRTPTMPQEGKRGFRPAVG
jgi:hypothetical protein